MALDGVNLVNDYCDDFFIGEGNRQQFILVIRDAAASAGAIGAGAAGLITGVAAAPAALGFTVATANSGLDIFTRNFLFGADNIDSVRALVSNAMNTHKSAVLPDPDNSTWTFGQAEQVILDHQDICRPAHILLLTRAAIANAPTEAKNSQGQIVTSCQSATTSGESGGNAVAKAATVDLSSGRPTDRHVSVGVPSTPSAPSTSCPPANGQSPQQGGNPGTTGGTTHAKLPKKAG